MTQRYWVFVDKPDNSSDIMHIVIDKATNEQWQCGGPIGAKKLADALNLGQDCRFNCRARREADYLQGWIDRNRGYPLTEVGKLFAKRYIDGAKKG